jgi:hypothetical protein
MSRTRVDLIGVGLQGSALAERLICGGSIPSPGLDQRPERGAVAPVPRISGDLKRFLSGSGLPASEMTANESGAHGWTGDGRPIRAHLRPRPPGRRSSRPSLPGSISSPRLLIQRAGMRWLGSDRTVERDLSNWAQLAQVGTDIQLQILSLMSTPLALAPSGAFQLGNWATRRGI